MNKYQVYITIPLYNDAKMILKVIKSLKDKGYNNIVVVDDVSKDNGYDVVKKNTDVIVVKHIINRGQGAALQTAMEIAIDKGAKYIVHFDSDGQHNPKDIQPMLNTLIEGNYDIVLGSRFLKKNNIPLNPVFINVSLQSLSLESKAQTYGPRRINYKMFLTT